MIWDPALLKIRDILAKLYDKPDIARLVAADLGIPKEMIPHYPTSLETWESIVSEAKKRGEKYIQALVERGIKQYDSEELRKANEEYLEALNNRRQAGGPNIGTKSYLTCDRKKHESAFNFYFDDLLRRNPGVPQVYIIPGDANQRHDSLVERFRVTSIVDYVKGQPQFGPDISDVPNWKVAINANEDAHETEKIFFNDLFNRGQPGFSRTATPSLAAFRELLEKSLCPALVIQHNILIAEWNKTGWTLMESYLQFLKDLAGDAPSVQIVVFFCIIYPVPRPSRFMNFIPQSWKRPPNHKYVKDIPKIFQLKKHAEAARWTRESPPCVLLDSLGCVKHDDVLDWFQSSNFGDDQINRFKWASMVIDENECKSMKEVETRLTEILLDLNKERGESEITRGQ